MGIHIRQVCLVAHRLQPAIHELAEVLGIESCYVDPGVGRFGLENNLLAIGTNFLEVVAPVEENTAAGRFLTKRRAMVATSWCVRWMAKMTRVIVARMPLRSVSGLLMRATRGLPPDAASSR